MDEEILDVKTLTESILDSVKKQLPIPESLHEFDPDIIMNINAAISTLTQLGVGPKNGFVISDSQSTYLDFLGEDNLPALSQVKMYLYYKTKLSFDPPQSSAVMECLKEMIKEAEFRLNIMCDNPNYDIGGDKDESS